ncbi:hypothetical protein TVAG_462750 [Trichomonas vaginalis G3]|uniref:WD repeat protein n=1 Tax=Trichomonas vaginalis (strain ATCC PRA-98 / G3) TaxID=412133 RepID=A2DLY6_TRIV3|nr:WD40 repeat-containing protein [Trichomonas vaginalis G3]EAY18589.1 hypothetical protein TVAG_462750 [Trichomonas vaginalis G3]KAI5491617.1 WD40 repeat-containing protein [Trichomonas vaginalis G3]|eukprot:XP_001579575.1 hypothetical protein [Trichomonas vaginalis G3]
MEQVSDNDFGSDAPPPEVKPEPQPKAKKGKIRKSKEYIEYAKSRRQYINHLTLSPSSILFMLETSNIKTGVQSRGTQHQPSRFGLSTQTDPITFNTASAQFPDTEPNKQQYPSTIHFLKAAAATISALLDQAEFSSTASDKQPLTRVSKFATKGVPLSVLTTKSRTVALVEESPGNRTLYVWNARSSTVNYQLVSPSTPTCFCIHDDARIIIAGTESGSILAWDLLKKAKPGQSETVLQSVFTTNDIPSKNHQDSIAGISVFGRRGTNVVCALDGSAIASFWHIRTENDEFSLTKAETVNLAATYFPTFSLAVAPNSVDSFLVGCGCSIFNCSRFGSTTSPSSYNASAAVRSIAFSKLIPTLFAAGQDNGKLAIYDILSADPLIEFCVDISTSDLSVCWSPKRASVLFVAATQTMRLFVYDLSKDMRKPIYTHKVSNAAYSVDAAETENGVILAIGEGDSSASVLRVKSDLSTPLSDTERDSFLMQLYGSY